MDLTKLFVDVDEFCKKFEHELQKIALTKHNARRQGQLSLSEIMTIAIAFQISLHQTFKHFYNNIIVMIFLSL